MVLMRNSRSFSDETWERCYDASDKRNSFYERNEGAELIKRQESQKIEKPCQLWRNGYSAHNVYQKYICDGVSQITALCFVLCSHEGTSTFLFNVPLIWLWLCCGISIAI